MIFGKHINRYYLKYAGWLLLGLVALVMVDMLQLEIPRLYSMVIDGMSYGYILEDGVQIPFTMDLVLDKIYTVASHDYMIKNGGDGFNMFMGCKLLQDEVMIDNQVLINYITGTLGGVVGEAYAEPYGQGRIVAVSEKPAE